MMILKLMMMNKIASLDLDKLSVISNEFLVLDNATFWYAVNFLGINIRWSKHFKV